VASWRQAFVVLALQGQRFAILSGVMPAERRMHAVRKMPVGAGNDHEIVTGVKDDHGFIF
jgi:hypothetical protein